MMCDILEKVVIGYICLSVIIFIKGVFVVFLSMGKRVVCRDGKICLGWVVGCSFSWVFC